MTQRLLRVALLLLLALPLMAMDCRRQHQCGSFDGSSQTTPDDPRLPTSPTVYCGPVTTLDNRPGPVTADGGDGTGTGGDGGTAGDGPATEGDGGTGGDGPATEGDGGTGGDGPATEGDGGTGGDDGGSGGAGDEGDGPGGK